MSDNIATLPSTDVQNMISEAINTQLAAENVSSDVGISGSVGSGINNVAASDSENKVDEFTIPNFEMNREMIGWMRQAKLCLFVTTYKHNRVWSFGTEMADGSLKPAVYNSAFAQPMGMFVCSERRKVKEVSKPATNDIWLATRGRLIYLPNHGERNDYESNIGKFSAVYMPRIIYNIGDCDPHDIVVVNKGGVGGSEVYFVSAKFNCVAKPSQAGKSFEVFWMPPWIDKLTAEDRCHLNGLAIRDNVPRYVTACGKTNSYDLWHQGSRRIGGGLVFDVVNNCVVCEGLTMPHSPRWYRDRLYVLNAGCGEFGYVEIDNNDESKEGKEGKFVVIKTLPGFLRGLRFFQDYAIIGSSDDRKEKRFQGLPLGDRLAAEGRNARCGVFVIDLRTGDVAHSLMFDNVAEIYDVDFATEFRVAIWNNNETDTNFVF